MIDQKTVGQMISKWRKKRNLTQDALSKKADIQYATLIKIETDIITNPSIQTVMRIVKGRGVSVDELIEGL